VALEQYANAPVLSTPTAAWTTLAGSILAGDTSLTVASASAFPSSAQFRILIEDELLLVTAGAGTTTWTVTRGVESTTAAAHSSGASVYHVLTAASLLRNPGALTTTGDVPYLASTGAPTRLAAGADGTYLRYASGIPTAAAIVLGDLPAGVGLTANPLSQFAATTSAQLRGVLSDETGTGAAVFADTPTLIAPLLGTPTSGLLSNCTGLPLASVTGLGTGVATFLGTPSSANLAAALTDETGSGAAVFGTSPTIVTPTIASFANATHTHLNAAGGGTLTAAAISDLATAAVAFSNKTGNISQWTNDSGYLTSVTAHNVLSATHGDTLTASVVRGDVIIGNSTPKWARLAVGAAASILSSDGTDVSWAAATGTGSPVRATSPTLVTPVLGVATATSLNGNTFTTGTYTLTGVAGKTLTFNKSLTLEGTDSTTMTFPTTSATIARTDAAQTFTGSQTIAALVGPVTITEAVGSSALTVTGATQTSSFPALSVTQTWNNSGTTFTGALFNITNTASAAASLVFDWQLSTVSMLSLTRAGILTFKGSSGVSALTIDGTASGTSTYFFKYGSSGVCGMGAYGGNTLFAVQDQIGFTSNVTNTTPTLFLYRAANATLQLGLDLNGAAISQTLQACNGVTGTDKTGGNLTLASGKGTGAGAVSSLIFQTPTVLASSTTAQSLATRFTITSGLVSLADATDLGIGTSTGSKIGQSGSLIGFYGVTPIARAVLATGAGATADNIITALQNLGLVKQS